MASKDLLDLTYGARGYTFRSLASAYTYSIAYSPGRGVSGGLSVRGIILSLKLCSLSYLTLSHDPLICTRQISRVIIYLKTKILGRDLCSVVHKSNVKTIEPYNFCTIFAGY